MSSKVGQNEINADIINISYERCLDRTRMMYRAEHQTETDLHCDIVT